MAMSTLSDSPCIESGFDILWQIIATGDDKIVKTTPILRESSEVRLPLLACDRQCYTPPTCRPSAPLTLRAI